MTETGVVGTRRPPWLLIIAPTCTLLLVTLSFMMKAQCDTGIMDAHGTAQVPNAFLYTHGCYSDIQNFWGLRSLYEKTMPYVHGYFVPPNVLGGGAIEYPVLSGLFIWLTSLPAHTAGEYLLVNAIALLPFALLTAVLLAILQPRRAWIWFAAPALVLYAVYNWDVIPAACTVIGVYLVWRAPIIRRPTLNFVLASVAFGLGAAFKLYPIIFLLPLCAWILFHGNRPARPDTSSVRAACATGVAGIGAALACNIPFIAINSAGWAAAFQFQAQRPIDNTTLSIWYYGVGLFRNPDGAHVQSLMMQGATVATFISVASILALGLLRVRRGRPYPWLEASASALCAYMLFNKVDSLQYSLWILPLLVLVSIPVPWVITWLVWDVLLFAAWSWNGFFVTSASLNPTATAALEIAVWGRVVLLAAFIVLFFRNGRRTTAAAEAVPETGPVTHMEGLRRHA